ncbi:MAG: squalene/phytoene synthase family protein [Pseudomonadota bacterium]|nr:squalene/phytoene synthase family protein [Pseudomonadota bacterium]
MSSPPPRPSAIADEALQSIGADRELALLHIPARVRDAFAALFAIDAAMGDVVARSTEPQLGRIKLAWWREQLEALDEGAPPSEPRLSAAAEQLLPLGIAGSAIAEIEPGWATLLDEQIDPQLVAGRGAVLFGIGGRILGSTDPKLAEAGSLYALAAVGRRGLPELFEPAKAFAAALRGHRFERRIRALTMLARAASRDPDRTEPEGSPRRVAAMLAHRWGGRIG